MARPSPSRPLRERTLYVDCPACGACVGLKCKSVVAKRHGRLLKRPHVERKYALLANARPKVNPFFGRVMPR